MQNKVINKRIENTNLYVFSKDAETGVFTYSRPLFLDEARAVAESLDRLIKTEYRGVSCLKSGLKVSPNGVLYNMSILKGILANRALMEQTKGNAWFPTIKEGFFLHDANLLPSEEEELMDFGIALYGDENPNQEIAHSLMMTSYEKKYAMPILASFKSLGLNLGGQRYGVMPALVSEDGLIRGQDARETLKRFLHNASCYGVCGLNRDSGGWYANWDEVGYADVDYRVGRVSALGSAKNLKDIVETQIKERFIDPRTKLEAELSELNNLEKACIASADRVLS